MLATMSALVATWYFFITFITAFSTFCAFDRPVTRNLFTGTLRKYLALVEVLASGMTECSLQIIIFKVFYIKFVNFFGGFNYTLSYIVWCVDVVNMAALSVLFYEMLSERSLANQSIKIIDSTSKPINTVIRLKDAKKLLNPMWTPSNIKIHPNITYATNEEIREAINSTHQDFDQPRKMMLDIYTLNEKMSGLSPVLVHIHGGAWQSGSKDIFYPHEKLLVSENNWVIVNIGYRLAPKNAYPTHLIDCKRAIRWIKQNIANFGGDPNFLVLSGDSAGAHLAAMVSLTANEPRFQPGFEEVDTSARGVISISGPIDLSISEHHTIFFSKKVANLDKMDRDFVARHNPAALIQNAKDANKLVPFLLISGKRDALTECEMSISFKKAYRDAVGDKMSAACMLILLPGGHHVSYVGWSPRSIYASLIIQTWCTQLYIKTNY